MVSLRTRKAVVAKVGFDAHWRGVIVVASALRDAGMEVVYLGHATAEHIVEVALQEDADLVGLSCLSGNHLQECPPVVRGLRAAGCDDVVVVVGGTLPPEDCRELERIGVHGVFPTGSALPEILERIADLLDTVRPLPSRAGSW